MKHVDFHATPFPKTSLLGAHPCPSYPFPSLACTKGVPPEPVVTKVAPCVRVLAARVPTIASAPMMERPMPRRLMILPILRVEVALAAASAAGVESRSSFCDRRVYPQLQKTEMKATASPASAKTRAASVEAFRGCETLRVGTGSNVGYGAEERARHLRGSTL